MAEGAQAKVRARQRALRSHGHEDRQGRQDQILEFAEHESQGEYRYRGNWTSTNDDTTEFTRESEFVFAFHVKRLRFGRRLKLEEYNKGAFMSIGGKEDNEECIVVEDIDGAEIKTVEAVPDVTEKGNVYCVPA